MHTLKLLFLRMAALLRQACLLPWWFARLLRRKRLQLALNALEAERLDRIRHPAKYLGK